MNIVITGGSSGLGQAIINIMAMNEMQSFRDATIYNIDNSEENYDELIPVTNVRIKNIKFDLLANYDETYAELVKEEFPEQIDILINNCGINYIEWIENLDMQMYDKVFNINVRSIVSLVKNSLQNLRGGTILNIISNASDMAMTNSIAYNGSKGALKIMTKQMARELGKTHEITVFGISPNKLSNTGMSKYIDKRVCELRGWTEEESQKYQVGSLPCGEETKTETLAEFIAFLLSSKDRHRYLQGCILPYGGPMSN